MPTPQIYKLAYAYTTHGYTLFYNVGNFDCKIATFNNEELLLEYLNTFYKKVGEITDYGLYIKQQPSCQ